MGGEGWKGVEDRQIKSWEGAGTAAATHTGLHSFSGSNLPIRDNRDLHKLQSSCSSELAHLTLGQGDKCLLIPRRPPEWAVCSSD